MRKLAAAIPVLLFLAAASCNRGPSPQDIAAQQATAQAAAQAAAYKTCVQMVLDADAALHDKDQPDVQAADMRKIDTSLCPTDFRQAYEAHIYAWENKGKIAIAQQRLDSDENVKDTIAATIFAGIVGSNDNPIDDQVAAEKELNRLKGIASQQVSDTYEQVRQVALKYGARLPS